MFKSIKSKLTYRNSFILGLISLVILNILLTYGYYRIFLTKEINNTYQEGITELDEYLLEISDNLEKTNDYNNYLSEYIKNKEIMIQVFDEDNNLIKTYSSIINNKSDNNVTVSNLIKLDNKHYLIELSKKRGTLSSNIITNFIIFELCNIGLLLLAGIYISNLKILSPITVLSRDVNNYKLGIKPHKRKINGSIDYIQNDFVDLVSKLEEEKKNQNRIIASISHDIKTPLTSILGYSERLLNNDISEDKKNKYIEIIYDKSKNLKDIVEEFDDYLSLHISDNEKYEKITIRYLVTYLKNYYKEDLKEKDIEFKIKSNCLNETIYVNFSKLKRVFANVITNSISHMDKKKKLINISINEQKNGKIEFVIMDNGTGCQENLDKIFEPLYTTDKSRKISGLGLSICKEIIEAHHGIIRAENNKLGGFSIIFTIDKYKE